MDDSLFDPQTGISYLEFNPEARRTVLLLHGLGADASSWFFQFTALVQADFRVIALDIPGFGKSQPLSGRWSIKSAVARINALLASKRVERVNVVGISMGGVLALELALDYAASVEKLVLVNTFACLRPRRLSESVYMLKRFAIANFRGVAYQAEMVSWRLFPQPEKADLRKEMVARILQADPKVYRQAMISLGLFDVTSRLGELKMPVLVISGANDTTVSLVNQKALVQGIAGVQHEIIENAGHAVIVDRPDEFNRILISFLGQDQ